jgi:CBS domain-containing protein
MALAYDLVKDRPTYSMEADRTVLEAARYMTERNIGALPVMKNGQLAGIFSERDIMTRVVSAGRAPGTTKLSEVMTPNPKAVDTKETIEDCMYLLREFGFRHLLITDGKDLKGLLSLRDILLAYAAEKEGGGAQRVAV